MPTAKNAILSGLAYFSQSSYAPLKLPIARWLDHSLFSEKHVTFEEDAGAYDQKDVAGFIKLNTLRLKLIATRNARVAAKG
jgi:argininosuccinate synthase